MNSSGQSRAFTNLESPFQFAMLVLFTATISYLAASLGGTLVVRPQMNWVLWPGNMLLVSLLLLVQKRIWPILIAAALAAFVFYDLQAGVTLRSAVLLILADTIEVLTAALSLAYVFSGAPKLNNTTALAKYILFAVILAPFLGAFVGAFSANGGYWTSWSISFFSEALGFLIIPPVIFAWIRSIQTGGVKTRAFSLELVLLIAGLAFAGYFTFVVPGKINSPALLYCTVPFLLWSALRFETIGVGTSVVIVALLSIWGTLHGRGPFVTTGSLVNVSSLQLFLFFTAGPFMILAAVVEERKDANRLLKESEEKFSKAFRQSPMSLTLTSVKDHRYIEVNDTFERLTGWKRDEVIGKTPLDIGLWVDPDKRKLFAKRLQAEASLQNFELQLRTRNGEVLTGLASSELIEINGEPCALSGVVDITDAKRADAEKRASERRFAEFFATLPEYCYMVSLSGELLDINPAACEAYGYTKAELVGKPFSFLYAPECQSKVSKLFEKWKRTGVLDNEEMITITKSGQRRTVLLNVGAVKDAGGNLLHSASVEVDITTQKQIQERLNESQKRLIGIVDSAMDAIVALDSQQRIIVFNEAAEKMFGCSAGEAMMGPIDRFIPLRFRAATETLGGGKGSMLRALSALCGQRANGDEFPIEASISQVGTGDKAIYTAIIRDVTERRQAEEALSMVSRRLIETQEQERTWVARELHDDINQRIAFLAVTLDVARRELPVAATEDRRRISEVKNRLQDLGQDVQALSHRLHSSKLEYLGLAKAAAAFCREFCERQEIQIDFRSDVIPKTLPAEISLCLFRVLQESVQNSAKHSRSAHFQVLLGYTSDHVCLEVRDSGVGFDLEEVMKGAGLGISSMRERLKIVNGELSIDSRVNGGTVIHARVPLRQAAAAVAGKAV